MKIKMLPSLYLYKLRNALHGGIINSLMEGSLMEDITLEQRLAILKWDYSKATSAIPIGQSGELN